MDDHILMVVRNMRRLALEAHSHELPFASALMHAFERKPVLYLAALFHDIAKGRGGDCRSWAWKTPAASAAANAPVVLPPAGQTQPEQPAENGGDNSGTGISAAYIDEMNKRCRR